MSPGYEGRLRTLDKMEALLGAPRWRVARRKMADERGNREDLNQGLAGQCAAICGALEEDEDKDKVEGRRWEGSEKTAAGRSGMSSEERTHPRWKLEETALRWSAG